MTGKLLLGGTPGRHTHAMVNLDRGVLRYEDQRQFGRIEVALGLPARVEKLGPEPLEVTLGGVRGAAEAPNRGSREDPAAYVRGHGKRLGSGPFGFARPGQGTAGGKHRAGGGSRANPADRAFARTAASRDVHTRIPTALHRRPRNGAGGCGYSQTATRGGPASGRRVAAGGQTDPGMNERLEHLPILILEPHNRCNCRCVMCDIWKLADVRGNHRGGTGAAPRGHRETTGGVGSVHRRRAADAFGPVSPGRVAARARDSDHDPKPGLLLERHAGRIVEARTR